MRSAGRLAILGSRDLAQLIAHHAIASGDWTQVSGFFDDFRKPGEQTPGGPILGGIDDAEELYAKKQFDALIVGIGYHHLQFREQCYQRFLGKLPIGQVRASGCYIDSTAHVGEGSFLLPGCVLDAGVTVGANCVLNTGVAIAHDSHIGDTSFLAPRTTVAGFVTVGKRCFLGVGTVVSNSVNIGDDVQTGAGSVVIGSLTAPGVYLGVPAKYHRPHR